MILIHRDERVVEIREPDAPAEAWYGVRLCADHLARTTAPVGWELIDGRAAAGRRPRPVPKTRPEPPSGEVPDPGAPAWMPRRARDIDELDELSKAASPLLRRAFFGSPDPAAADGQLWLRV